ncbi:MAG: threonylcarbamoyl-AMP synthase [Candidatus Terrybacteria bacterium RIFCSPHIGHO2_01_FULL_48_17]|uniref:L-threonylcarbamoyladenylate synthase n=1 Tax=Candidatus Terrybacteria bacterium RIFCSPHIGHO2_01_FULL_48_17 TaxID=1802362 RepID=A0A1G2PHA7_9BACT|nr:MAG: threonylcarbamoyl-AMP synthase [Candidatus Terrybacteria bacterium RIFCSPHIGHO2_01_FULL_48_17]OHA52257.1 MAG: threonylcarbamoyl-AMP synthase [Candidatus Terrybacteria bacterium RIFCSPLOWO2_01_FULL_48_14]
MIPIVSLRSHNWLVRALSVLRHGGILIYPTDTVYGMGCDVTNKKALRRLLKIKRRPYGKPFPVLVSDFAMAERFAKFPNWVEPLPKILWPGPWTFLVEARRSLPRAVVWRNTIGVRAPDHHLLQKLIHKFDGPIVGTSANISGNTPASTARVAARIFCDADLIIDGGRLFGKPSTVIRVTSRGLAILRS